MPLVFTEQIDGATKLGVWHITEPEDFFSAGMPLQRSITHPHKRLQHLAGRYLLRELFPDFPLELIRIADTRKPFLADEAFHFSISHCGDFAAVIISRKNRVGVDIEIPQEKIERIAHKFLSANEATALETLPAERAVQLTLAWSIKEAIFKWYGDGGVDFIENIRLEKVHFNGTAFSANCVFEKENSTRLKVHSIMLKGNVLSRVITRVPG